MNKNKYDVGSFVLYKSNNNYNLGEIKKIVPQTYTKFNKFGATEYTTEGTHYAYFVYFNRSDQCLLIDEEELYMIVNLDAFDIERKKLTKDKDRLIAELIDLLGELGVDKRDVVELLISCGYSVSEASEYYFGPLES